MDLKFLLFCHLKEISSTKRHHSHVPLVSKEEQAILKASQHSPFPRAQKRYSNYFGVLLKFF